jgi:hypothetical protein
MTKGLITGIFLLVCTCSFAQNDMKQLPKFLPPPPDAFNIVKSADASVGLHTGTAQIRVPLFEYKAGGQSYPLSVQYSSNGVLVDELPSKVGMNWTFNPGGVITRVIMDDPDETNPLKTPPADAFNLNQLAEYVHFMSLQGTADGYNTQPDEYQFSVGNLSGKFFYDHNGVLRLSSYSKIKIEKKPSGNTVDWDYKLTDENGIKYFFGGTGAIERAKNQNAGCPRIDYATFVTVAWHLRRIEYPNGETATYTYTGYNFTVTDGITQTIMAQAGDASYPTGFTLYGSIMPPISATTCQTITNNEAVALQSISCSNGTAIGFTYTNREDIPNEKAFEHVSLSYGNEIVKKFRFNYVYSNSGGNYQSGVYQAPTYFPINFGQKRLFLMSIQEVDKTNSSSSLSTIIDYDDINGLPPRLSTSQDHYGYSNGVSNPYYFPKPNLEPVETSVHSESVGLQIVNNFNTRFGTTFTGNKEPNFNFAKKGTLSKITYPTGGSTSITWEPNSVNKELQNYPALQNFSLSALGSCPPPGSNCVTRSFEWITLSFQQYVNISFVTGSIGQEDIIHSKAHIYVYNTSNQLIHTYTLGYNQNYYNSYLLSSGTYKIELVSTNNSIPAGLYFSYRPGNTNPQNQNISIPGLRVKSIFDSDGNGNTVVKNYAYASVNEPEKSSGQILPVKYYQSFNRLVNYGYYWWDGDPFTLQIVGQVNQTFDKLQSSTNYRSYNGGKSAINYEFVVESVGSSYNNGVVEHKFQTSYNSAAQIIYGNDIPSAPLSDNNFFDGLELEKNVYKKENNQFKLISKTVNSWAADNRNFGWTDGYVVYLKNVSTERLAYNSNDPHKLIDFDIVRYPRYYSWVQLKKQTHYTYDDNNNQLKVEKDFTYDNINVLKPSSETTTSSNQSILRKEYKYVPDYLSISGLSSSAQSSSIDMLSKNIYTPLLETKTFRNNNLLSTDRTEFVLWGNGQNLPAYQWSSLFNNPLEKTINFQNYNAGGEVTELSKVNDVPIAYVWRYNNLYPVLEAVNCSSNEIFYESFEENPTATNDDYAKTGKKVKLNVHTVNFVRPNAKQYEITYHIWDGTKWVFNKSPYNGSSFIVTGNKIDEIRIAPINVVSIKTYSYKPYIGVTSMCDENGKTTYYEYDNYNRLSLVRDQDYNIVKKICYNYFGQQQNCITSGCTNLTAIWQSTGVTRCQPNATCGVTGYQESEEQDVNSCSPTFGSSRWVLGAYNPTLCANISQEQINVINNGGIAGLLIKFTLTSNPTITYTYPIPTSSGLVGCIPSGSQNLYNVEIYHSGQGVPIFAEYTFGGLTVSGLPARFKSRQITSSSNTLIINNEIY